MKNENGKWKCDYCNYESEKEGYCRNHELLKHGNKSDSVKENKKASEICPDCGGIKFKMLNPAIRVEKMCILEGYKKLCVKCGEVI